MDIIDIFEEHVRALLTPFWSGRSSYLMDFYLHILLQSKFDTCALAESLDINTVTIFASHHLLSLPSCWFYVIDAFARMRLVWILVCTPVSPATSY